MQRAQIVELACLEPIARGLHITHWTSQDLARQAVADGLIESISPPPSGKSSTTWTCSPTAPGIGRPPASTPSSRSGPRRCSGATATRSGWPVGPLGGGRR